jgi:hypothetical protein
VEHVFQSTLGLVSSGKSGLNSQAGTNELLHDIFESGLELRVQAINKVFQSVVILVFSRRSRHKVFLKIGILQRQVQAINEVFRQSRMVKEKWNVCLER